jgi:hypothetical protein
MRSGCDWRPTPATSSTSEIATCLDYTTAKVADAEANDESKRRRAESTGSCCWSSGTSRCFKFIEGVTAALVASILWLSWPSKAIVARERPAE